MMKKIAVLGAGLTGAAAAAALTQAGHQVTVFDKGRAAGGRMSSKRAESGYLDLGAQYFTARSDVFKQQVQRWLDAGDVELWRCTTALLAEEDGVLSLASSKDDQQRFIGVPAMHSPIRALLADQTLIKSCRIVQLSYQQQSWVLRSECGDTYQGFDAVVLTLPPAQSQQLLAQSSLPELLQTAAGLLDPCWAVAMQTQVTASADAIFCQHPKLRFISHQQQKTARVPCYVLHFNAAFSAAHLDENTEFWFAQAEQILRHELQLTGDISPLVAHRWLYASQRDQASTPGLLALPKQHLWAGGDWSYGGRVENAYLAGIDLATEVITQFSMQQENV